MFDGFVTLLLSQKSGQLESLASVDVDRNPSAAAAAASVDGKLMSLSLP